MMNFGALKWFRSFIKKLKKALDCINHMIYTCDYEINTDISIVASPVLYHHLEKEQKWKLTCLVALAECLYYSLYEMISTGIIIDIIKMLFHYFCHQGENHTMESICQTVMSIKELVDVVNDPTIDNNIKRPYLRYILWAYINTHHSLQESGIVNLPQRM